MIPAIKTTATKKAENFSMEKAPMKTTSSRFHSLLHTCPRAKAMAIVVSQPIVDSLLSGLLPL